MIPGDISDIPTLACLNKPQKRALILRDQLRYLEPAHLDTFLDGVTADEPPTYRSVNGNAWPPLAQITIKEDATRFDLGNVQFPEEGGKTCRAYLTVEDERFEMRTEDPLPKDDAELASVAIHRFVAENMFPLFKTKYKAIHARMEKMNEARRVAYNMLDHPPAKFEEGETLARLHSAKPKADEEGSRKRREVTKHISNKRQRIGLDTIPDTVKSETFNTMPAQIKVALFNNIIKTAFPNFDNLIIASWNVVSVYANVGSDFPELHRAIVELKGALDEFESAYTPRARNGRGRKETTPVAAGKEGRSTPGTGAKQTHDDERDAPTQHHQPDNHESDISQHRIPPPRPHNQQQAREIQYAPLQSDQTRFPTTNTTATTTHPPPVQLNPTRHNRNRNPTRSPAPPDLHSAPGAELMRKRQAYASSLSKSVAGGTGAAKQQQQERERQKQQQQEEEKQQEQEEEQQQQQEQEQEEEEEHTRSHERPVRVLDRVGGVEHRSSPASASASTSTSTSPSTKPTHAPPAPPSRFASERKMGSAPVAAMVPVKRGGGC